jgi:hypothetical protein
MVSEPQEIAIEAVQGLGYVATKREAHRRLDED